MTTRNTRPQPIRNPRDTPSQPQEWRDDWYACDTPTCAQHVTSTTWHTCGTNGQRKSRRTP